MSFNHESFITRTTLPILDTPTPSSVHIFFRNEERTAVTINGMGYRHMLNTFLFPKMQKPNIDTSYFHQSPQFIEKTIWWNVISRNGPVDWPPRSCDLTPPDYFCSVYIKSMVYADKPTTLEALEVNINRAINEIDQNYWKKWSKISLIGCAS